VSILSTMFVNIHMTSKTDERHMEMYNTLESCKELSSDEYHDRWLAQR
jgi:hypothetical protein